jgi:hypothetical protein
MKPYDVFISYRRDSGAAEARLIRSALMEKGKQAFLDVIDLHSGYFDDALLGYITQAANFIVIFSPGALNRCADEEDWFRREIVQAIKTSSNIVPVLLPGFTFPPHAQLPEELRSIPRHQGVDYSHRYFDAMIAEILQACEPANTRKRKVLGEAVSVTERRPWADESVRTFPAEQLVSNPSPPPPKPPPAPPAVLLDSRWRRVTRQISRAVVVLLTTAYVLYLLRSCRSY